MKYKFTRRALYDLVWTQPMKTLAESVGISDVALAKQCKRANIPVPNRGYWARKQAGKPVVQIALPPRFPGAPDIIGGSDTQPYFYGSDWPQKVLDLPIPSIPIFDEDIAAVEDRARRLVGKLHYTRNFEPAHPLVAKLLAHDEERRREFIKWRSSYYAPKYDAGIERRRLLIINALFMAAARLGCRPSMSTSKYGQGAGSERQLNIAIGESNIYFTIEPVRSKNSDQKERLNLAFGMARDRANSTEFWEDNGALLLENHLTVILVEMLISAERLYRDLLIRRREWIINRKTEAQAEIKRREEEAERKVRELQDRQERERIGRLLSQANALDRANRIRVYVETVLARTREVSVQQADIDQWAAWACREADRIDPVKNGAFVRTIEEHLKQRHGEKSHA